MTVDPWEEYCKLVMSKLDEHDGEVLALNGCISKLHQRINGLIMRMLMAAAGIIVYLIQDHIFTK